MDLDPELEWIDTADSSRRIYGGCRLRVGCGYSCRHWRWHVLGRKRNVHIACDETVPTLAVAKAEAMNAVRRWLRGRE